MKKSVLALCLAFLATAIYAQDPPPPVVNCVTNIEVFITNSNSYISGGTNYMSQPGNNLTIIAYDSLCPSTNTTIGFVRWTCDSSIHCGYSEGSGPTYCPGGGSAPLVMPAGVWQTVFNFYSSLGCCTVKCDYHFNDQSCIPADGGCGGYQP